MAVVVGIKLFAVAKRKSVGTQLTFIALFANENKSRFLEINAAVRKNGGQSAKGSFINVSARLSSANGVYILAVTVARLDIIHQF